MERKVFSAIIATAVASVLIFSVMSPDMQDEKYTMSTFSTDDSDEFYRLSCQVYEVYGPIIICLGAVMFGAIVSGVAISKEDDEKEGMCQ